MPDLRKKEIDFIWRYRDEIVPITRYSEVLKVVKEAVNYEDISNKIDLNKIDYILEEFETKVFVSAKSEVNSDAKSILVEADNPGAYAVIKPLVDALLKDGRCESISAIMSGTAANFFQRDFGDFFSRIRDKNNPVLVDILDAIKKKPLDVVIATLNSNNAPDSVVLFGSKSSLGAKKLFLVLESYGQELNRTLAGNIKNMDPIDGVFCNDELAKKMFLSKFTEFSLEKVHSFGTPILDSLDLERAGEYRKICREKFGIDESTAVFLYLGAISLEAKDWYNSADDVDEQTLKNALSQVAQFAEERPDKNFVFALRSHPRDSAKEVKYSLARNFVFPKNLLFRDASAPLSINESTYGSDIILSIVSTENFLAPRRGRHSIFLGFSGVGMGKDLLEKVLGKEAIRILSEDSVGISIVDSPEDFKDKISILLDIGSKNPTPIQGDNNTQKILDIVLGR